MQMRGKVIRSAGELSPPSLQRACTALVFLGICFPYGLGVWSLNGGPSVVRNNFTKLGYGYKNIGVIIHRATACIQMRRLRGFLSGCTPLEQQVVFPLRCEKQWGGTRWDPPPWDPRPSWCSAGSRLVQLVGFGGGLKEKINQGWRFKKET